MYKLNPIQYFFAFLLTYSVLLVVFSTRILVYEHFFVIMGTALAVFYGCKKLLKKNKSLLNTLITALIIFLVLDPGWETPEVHYVAAGATAFAVLSKFFLEHKGRPFINPVVFALLIVASISPFLPFGSAFISWWGASFREPLSLILILGWIFTGLGTWKKFSTVYTFLGVYAAYLFMLGLMDGGDFSFMKFVFTTGTIYFMTSIMLIEPKTSPIKRNHQVAYGLVAAGVFIFAQHFKMSHAELLAIAAANVLNILFTYGRFRLKAS